jgi:nickel-dependent lactate racemase
VVPHHIPGFAAGAKIVQPGVSGAATTAATHMFSARAPTPLLGQVDSPVRREMDEIAQRSNMHHVLNVTLNDEHELVTARFGSTRDAFRRAVGDAQRICGVPTARNLDIVVTGSHPCDLEFWQAHKSLYPAAMIVRPGGTMIVVTPCPEGVAVTHQELLEYGAESADQLHARFERGETRDDVAASMAVGWARLRERAQVVIVSDGIPEADARALGFSKAADVAEALARAKARAPASPTLGVLTHGPITLPLVS